MWGWGPVPPEAPPVALAPLGLHAGTWLAWPGAQSEGTGVDSSPSGPAPPPQAWRGGAGRRGGAVCRERAGHRLRPPQPGPGRGGGTEARPGPLASGVLELLSSLEAGWDVFPRGPQPPGPADSGAWPLGVSENGGLTPSVKKWIQTFKKFGHDPPEVS